MEKVTTLGEFIMAIKQCSCENEYQDKRYGKNQRVHNQYLKEGGGWRCTVCDKDKPGLGGSK